MAALKKYLLLSIILLGAVSVFVVSAQQREEKEEVAVFVVKLRGAVDPVMNRYTKLALEEAKRVNADVVLLDMDTYGGAVKDADDIRTRILDYDLPIHVFINKNAASAGALISIACDSIYMAPGSSFGASTVVDQEGNVVPEKYQSFMRSKMRSTAEAKDRNPEIAAGMVGRGLSSDSAEVIAFTPKEAMENEYCEGIVSSVDQLITDQLGISKYRTVSYQLNTTEKIIHWFLNPAVKSILVMLILGGLYLELQSPGVGLPLGVALVAVALYFVPSYLNGFLGVIELVIFFIGVILLLVEVFVLPGFGVAGILGIITMIAGLVMSMLNNDGFNFSFVSIQEIINAFIVVSVSLIGGALMILFGGTFIANTAFFRKISLTDTITGRTNISTYVEGERTKTPGSFIGKTGIAYTDLKPSGKIMVDDELYEGQAGSGYIEKGSRVRIVSDKGVAFKVRKVTS